MPKLEFPIGKIMSVTDARNNFSKIVEEVEGASDGKYLLTKGGKPSVVIVNAGYLEKLIGEKPVSLEEPQQKIAATPPSSAQETPTQNPSQVTPSPQSTAQQPPTGEQDQQINPLQPRPQPTKPPQ